MTEFPRPLEVLRMQLIYMLFGVLVLTLGQIALPAQTIPRPSQGPDCGSAEGNVNAVAEALGVCADLKQLLPASVTPGLTQPDTPELRDLLTAPGTPLRGLF